MFTTCPACYRQYRIHAGQLKAAQGQVRCGYCGEQFNALERLSDKPVPLSLPPQSPPEPELRLSRDAQPKPAADDADTGLNLNTQQSQKEIAGTDDSEPDFDIPAILRHEERPPSGKMARLGWSLAILLLLLVMVAQLAWYNRDFLLQEYPQLEPWAQRICDRMGCEIIRHYSTSSIKLLNRDVRSHPHYADTLLVNAAMANQSTARQPYPKIQFALFDTNGKIIASRIFSPREYLDNSIDIKNGMPPNQPVHFVLEVAGPTATAVSFEFRFL